MRTLLINGYSIDAFDRLANEVSVLSLRKRDLLGAEAKMLLAFATSLSEPLVQRLLAESTRHNSTPIVVAMKNPLRLPDSIRQFPIADFYKIMGGEVDTSRILAKGLKEVMEKLGHNRLPKGFEGTPDDLLEQYSEECLKFLLGCPVRRYGQERRFEPLPDGLALARNNVNIYFDAKAYGSEFHPTADDIRRFSSYIQDFNGRYERYVGRISLFLVVSGSFSSSATALKEKSNELMSQCGTYLLCIKAADLASAVDLVRTESRSRGAINWRKVLIPELFEIERLNDELDRIRKDAIVQ